MVIREGANGMAIAEGEQVKLEGDAAEAFKYVSLCRKHFRMAFADSGDPLATRASPPPPVLAFREAIQSSMHALGEKMRLPWPSNGGASGGVSEGTSTTPSTTPSRAESPLDFSSFPRPPSIEAALAGLGQHLGGGFESERGAPVAAPNAFGDPLGGLIPEGGLIPDDTVVGRPLAERLPVPPSIRGGGGVTLTLPREGIDEGSMVEYEPPAPLAQAVGQIEEILSERVPASDDRPVQNNPFVDEPQVGGGHTPCHTPTTPLPYPYHTLPTPLPTPPPTPLPTP